MAEGFEPYHVPQQSRRDKLRLVAQSHSGTGCVDLGLLPLYDSSLLSSDLLTCANNHSSAGPPVGLLKEGGVNGNLMGFVSSSSSSQHHPYMDPQSSLPLNPYFYPSHQNFQNLRSNYDHQSYNGHGDQVVLYKPEPLSLTHQDCTSTSTGQGLSLSLSSHHTHHNNLPLELNYMVPAGIVGAGGGGSAATSNDVSRSLVPLGPFTGYSSILKGSKFLKPAQQLMEELCDAGRAIYAQKMAPDSALTEPSMDSLNASSGDLLSCVDGSENRQKKSRLLSMLDEVYRRYKQYYQQMQAVVASFEYVAGLSNAAPYANLALKAMSKHFRFLKNAITDQLQFNNKAHGPINHGKDEAPRFGNSERGIYGQRPIRSSGSYDQQPVWRPQRGLPERAVSVLRAWLFEHFLHPYPTDTDKTILAKQTGLTRSQVSNWFINARVRLWKPMVEEIHMLEMRQAQKGLQREERNANRSSDNNIASSNSLVSENPSTSTQRIRDNPPSKHGRDDFAPIYVGSEEALNLSYHNLSSHQHLGVSVGMAVGSGVSLTLGLHQNNGIGFSESYPLNAAQRFGLEGSNQGYVMGNFEVQN